MIAESQTNFLYLTDTLPKRHPGFYFRFEKALSDYGISFAILPHTKDIWAIDFMPVQTAHNRFIRFLYQPSYLTNYKKYAATISNVDFICEEMGLPIIKSNIKLDGGNLVKTTDKVIMTERVFKENPGYEKNKLIQDLYELLQVEKLFFIPEQPGDFSGHADGMVRFVDANTVVINDFKKEQPRFQFALDLAIQKTGLDTITIPYNVYDNDHGHQANGSYINYLELGNTIIIPTFGRKEDDEAVKHLETIFKGREIGTIESNDIANEGGILHCISWTILK